MEVPPELRARRQWMLWRDEYGTKVPYQINGHRAKSNDPATWTDFDSLIGDKIAFNISADDPYCGIDLDGCYDGTKFLPWAQEILSHFEGVAYAEFSPSGNGVKLTTRANKPEGSRCTHKFGDKKEQLECYDHSRFWTFTGNGIAGFDAIGDGQEAVNWLCEKYLQGEKRATGSKRPASAGGCFELLARAESYADAFSPASKGNLRNSAFQNAGHLHALVGKDGERLSDTDVYNLLKRWNLRNSDPLRDDELKEAAVNGRKNGTPPADKPPQDPDVLPEVDLSGILNEAIESQRPDVPFSPGDFPRSAMPTGGIIGELMAYNLATALYPQPELAFSGAIALMSAITGRKIQDIHGTRTNAYILAIGESGTGKEHARKVNKQVLYACGGEWMLGPERLPSHAGLVTALKDRLTCLYQLDEMGHLLATMKNPGRAAHLYNIGVVLMQLYSSSDTVWVGDGYADSKQTPVINCPHAVVYGTATPDSFWSNLTTENVSNGLLGRMLAFEAPGYVDRQKPAKVDIPEGLRQAVSWWVDTKPGGIDISRPIAMDASYSREAERRFDEHLDGIQDRRHTEDSDRRALWSRTGEKTAKLALIFACSRQQSERVQVELDDVERAIAICNWLTRRMLFRAYDYVALNQVEDAKKRLLRVLDKDMTRSELTRKTQWLKSRERNEILAELVEAGLIKSEEVQTSGRTKSVLRRA